MTMIGETPGAKILRLERELRDLVARADRAEGLAARYRDVVPPNLLAKLMRIDKAYDALMTSGASAGNGAKTPEALT